MTFCARMLTAAAAMAIGLGLAISAAHAGAPRSIAFLSVEFQNDNEEFEPTSAAERARMELIEDILKRTLHGTGQYQFVTVPPEVRAKIAAGQPVGHCAGCEVAYGKELRVDTVAWIEVQKVSNLILNMNLYISDVATGKPVFAHSVDIRGNTDESWSRSLTYLLNNYLLRPAT